MPWSTLEVFWTHLLPKIPLWQTYSSSRSPWQWSTNKDIPSPWALQAWRLASLEHVTRLFCDMSRDSLWHPRSWRSVPNDSASLRLQVRSSVAVKRKVKAARLQNEIGGTGMLIEISNAPPQKKKVLPFCQVSRWIASKKPEKSSPRNFWCQCSVVSKMTVILIWQITVFNGAFPTKAMFSVGRTRIIATCGCVLLVFALGRGIHGPIPA